MFLKSFLLLLTLTSLTIHSVESIIMDDYETIPFVTRSV